MGDLETIQETPKEKRSFFKKKPKAPKDESNMNDEEMIIDVPEEKQKRSFFSKKKKDESMDVEEGEKEHKSSFFKLRKKKSSSKLDEMESEVATTAKEDAVVLPPPPATHPHEDVYQSEKNQLPEDDEKDDYNR